MAKKPLGKWSQSPEKRRSLPGERSYRSLLCQKEEAWAIVNTARWKLEQAIGRLVELRIECKVMEALHPEYWDQALREKILKARDRR